MSDPLREEFIASFEIYVTEDRDMRRSTLEQMLKVPADKIVSQQMVEPHDMAALMSNVVIVDPRSPGILSLMQAYRVWQDKMREAEEPEGFEYVFRSRGDAEFVIVSNFPGLSGFIKSLPNIPGGQAYLAKILVCLTWAHQIPKMVANLLSPQGRKE